MPESNPRTESLFAEALCLESPEERAKYLAQACGADQKLRAQVEELLAAYPKAERFLESRARAPAATVEELSVLEQPGTVIGPYKLLEQIGEGGFGVVFMAEQQQPVRRKVALKVLKPGMDTRQVVARFEAERQALAIMDHPHIAKVLDGGETAAGRPYFVMELVKGVPITHYCDQNQLTARERLDLFVQVCQAVQHAHQKGIIHRDVKPSNVLVSRHDGTPVVKVIDFGIAKALGQQLTDKTLFTNFAQLVGTPLYMSPEQAGMSDLDVDTRSDIYSLGVLLYELLTGTTPFDQERLRQAGFDELRRIIREEEPPKPSTRISTLGQAATTVGTNRKSDPKQLSRLFRGELDWIVMKALEKDRNRRYETASAFAADVQRYLHDEPVHACPPSAWYRLRKFARRNMAALTTLVLLAAALLSVVVVLVFSNLSIRQEEKAKSEALVAKDEALKDKSQALIAKDAALEAANASRQQAEANLTLILAALDEVYITEAEKRLAAYRSEPRKPGGTDDPRPAQVERDFLQKGMGFYEKLIQPGRAEPAARFQTGKAYRRVGILQRELKQYDKAADSLTKAISLLDKLAEESPTEAHRWELALAYLWQGAVTSDVRRFAEAEQAYRRAIPPADRLGAEFPTSPDYRTQAAACRISLGFALGARKRTPEAEAVYLEGVNRWQKLADDFPANRWYRHELAFNLDSLGWLWEGANQPEKAESFFRQALEYHEKLVAEDATLDDSPERLARTHQHLAQVLTRMGRLPEAQEARRKALEVLEKLDPKTVAGLHARAATYRDLEQYDKALADYSKAIELEPMNAEAWIVRGWYYCYGLHQFDKALADYSKAIELEPKNARAWQERGYVYNNLPVPDYKKGLADCSKAIELDPKFAPGWHERSSAEVGLGKYDKALADADQAVKVDPINPWSWAARARMYTVFRNYDKALADSNKAIELDPNNHWAWNIRGLSHGSLHKYDEAVADFTKAIELRRMYGAALLNRGRTYNALHQYDKALADFSRVIELDPKSATAHSDLGAALAEQGKREDAIAAYRKAIALKPDYAEAHCNLGQVLAQQGEFRQALVERRRGHELGSRRPGWPYPSAQWVREAERLVELDGKLPAILEGKATPASAAERIELAGLCSLKHLNRAAVRFYEEAFAEQPKLAENLQAFYRYNAACAAALAGCGQGQDADKLDAKEKARLRGRALSWLRADLEARRGQLKSWWPGAADQARQAVQHALEDPDFAGVRGPEALAKLPEAERQPWQQLWQDVADMLKPAQRKPAPEKKPDAK